jgi:hypothetical protein
MLLAEVLITLATDSNEAAPTFMRSYFELSETAEIAKAYAALKLPRFRGHRTIWVRGVHDGQDKSSLPA